MASTGETGVIYPGDGKKTAGSTVIAQALMAASVARVDPAQAEAIVGDKRWRENYPDRFAAHVATCAASAADCVQVCKDGLEYLYSQFRFERNGAIAPFAEGFARAREAPDFAFASVAVVGELRDAPIPADNVGFTYEGKWLHGESMVAQMRKWAAKGTIEQSAADAVEELLAEPGWTDLRDRYFVVMGAGAAMGPTEALLRLGANVIAVDINIPAVWERLIALAKGSRGQLIIPTRGGGELTASHASAELAAAAGCDLLTEGPEICNWLCGVCPGQQLTVGSYCYLDGPKFIRVVLAMDAVTMGVADSRPGTAVAYLCSPTDCFTVPAAAMAQSEAQRSSVLTQLSTAPLRVLSRGRFFSPNGFRSKRADGSEACIVPAFVMQQGPNYALAKRIQHWRAMLLKSQGQLISTNVAPASKTVSVMKQDLLKAAYSGLESSRIFHPIEVFPPEVSNNMMCYLMIHDTTSPTSTANPATTLDNPADIFMFNACHNGFWRSAFVLRSLVEVSAVAGLAEPYKLPIGGSILALLYAMTRAKL